MGQLVGERDQLKDDLQKLQSQYGEESQPVKDKKLSITIVQGRIERRAADYRQFHVATGQSLGDPRNPAVATAGKSLDELRADEQSLQKLLDKTQIEMKALSTNENQLHLRQQELQDTRAQQEVLDKKVTVWTAEGQLGGRLRILSTGEISLTPEIDRRLRVAAIAGAGGAGLPIALIIMWSFVGRRYHYSDDTEADFSVHRIPLLGILPEVVDPAADAEAMGAAARSVHQLRVTLRSAAGASAVYMVTSATAGEGKTSLAISIGLSFAAARLKTLVIDGDLVGRKLTQTLGAAGLEGFHEAITERTFGRRVRRTPEGLYVLPAGNASAMDACALSPAVVRDLLSEIRKHFDVVLIDTGPILGSIEASVLAREADGVIFTISRGQKRHLVEKSLRRIASLGGSVVGCVFNRANMKDFINSPYGSSSRSEAAAPVVSAQSSAETDRRYARYGSLVKAVAVSLPACVSN
jgi:capsular exopolysaccharide synthesis family protein